VPGLTRLAQPIPVRFRLITGKQISPSPYEGRLLQLSPVGAELETGLALEVFSSLQVELPGPMGGSFLIDGKVVGLGEAKVAYILRFTGLNEATAATVNLWLNRG
jgi:hypothetical protein